MLLPLSLAGPQGVLTRESAIKLLNQYAGNATKMAHEVRPCLILNSEGERHLAPLACFREISCNFVDRSLSVWFLLSFPVPGLESWANREGR